MQDDGESTNLECSTDEELGTGPTCANGPDCRSYERTGNNGDLDAGTDLCAECYGAELVREIDSVVAGDGSDHPALESLMSSLQSKGGAKVVAEILRHAWTKPAVRP